MGYNFEPSEIDAAFGLVQLDRLPGFLARRKTLYARHREFFAKYPDLFARSRQLDEVDTAWLLYPVVIQPDAGFNRREFQAFLEERGIWTRMIWSGNLLRHPGFRDVPARRLTSGYPNADAAMERGVAIHCGPGLSDEHLAHVHDSIAEFVASR